MSANESGSTERVAPLPIHAAREAATHVGLPDYLAEINVFRVLLHRPALAKALYHALDPVLLHGTIDARLRELVIMRVGWVTGSYYEWGQHWHLGPMFGAPSEDLAAVRDWEHDDRFGPVERAVLAATDVTLAGEAITDDLWAELGEALPQEVQRVELVVLIGTYQMLSGVLRSLRVPLDDGLAVWPPDGLAPDA